MPPRRAPSRARAGACPSRDAAGRQPGRSRRAPVRAAPYPQAWPGIQPRAPNDGRPLRPCRGPLQFAPEPRNRQARVRTRGSREGWSSRQNFVEPLASVPRPRSAYPAVRLRAAERETAHETTVDVLIAGGGPFGLMLANELGRRGVSVALFDAKPSTAVNPQANATQARTMEHYRRLGFADEIRALGLPADFPTDIAYFTRFAKHELARFRLPSAREAKEWVGSLGGSWSAAELPHRVSQKYVEAALRRHAEKLPGISLNFGWRLVSFREEEGQVVADIECVSDGSRRTVRGSYIVGADGPRSAVRQQMGWRYTGETGVQRDFMG